MGHVMMGFCHHLFFYVPVYLDYLGARGSVSSDAITGRDEL